MAREFYNRLLEFLTDLTGATRKAGNECPYWAEDGQSEDIRALRF